MGYGCRHCMCCITTFCEDYKTGGYMNNGKKKYFSK